MRTPVLAAAVSSLGLLLAACSAPDDGASAANLAATPADAPGASSASCGAGPCAETTSVPIVVKNGVKDGAETDVDCGGPTADKCDDGKACLEARDCTSSVCGEGLCQPPSPSDGVENGSETDVDCGGDAAPKCVAEQGCVAPSDCTSNACSPAGKCQVAPSCTGKLGAGNHCGPGMGESCCASARVPAAGGAVWYSVPAWTLNARVSPFHLDKYEVTTGRLRAFFEAMKGNPQASFPATFGEGAGAHPRIPGSGWRSAWNKRLPASWADIQSRYGAPADAAGGTQFCMRGQGGEFGTTTWRKTPDDNASTIDNFEVKPVVCLDWYTLFAFCAWDGGRLPTSIEWGLAAGDDQGQKYAWGNEAPDKAKLVTGLAGFVPYPDFTWGLPYRAAGDRGTHIAPPGQKLVTRHGQYDLAGNVAEWLLDSKVPRGTCEDCANLSQWSDPTLAWPDYEPTVGAGHPTWKDGGYRVVRGGSWEGHDFRNVEGTWDGVEVGFTYHALGGRCARDL